MSIYVEWDDPELTLIRYTLRGRWTWDELWKALEKAAWMSSAVDHRVDVIVDLSDSTWVPPGALTQLQNMLKRRPPNRGIVVVYGGNLFVRGLAGMLRQMTPSLMIHYSLATSEAEAYTRIRGEEIRA